MKHTAKIILLIIIALVPTGASAQSSMQSFDEFRKSVMNDYREFRSDVLSQYGKFLDSVWKEYPHYEGVKRNSVPKPVSLPSISNLPPTSPNHIPTPKPTAPATPSTVPSTPSAPSVRPQTPHRTPTAPSIPSTPKSPSTPVRPAEPTPPGKDKIVVDFYNIPLEMADVNYNIPDNLNRKSASEVWKLMDRTGYHKAVISEIHRVAGNLNLNDYLTYILTDKYVDKKFKNHTPFSREVLKHFLLANMGYDVRLAETGSGKPLLLMPFNQMVYARTYMMIDGKRYYVMGDTQVNTGESVYTCVLPQNMDLGKSFELKINGLNLPQKNQQYSLKYGDIEITGMVNANIFPILYKYPQMPIGDYARSYISDETRNDIIRQMKAAVAGKSKKDAAEAMLHFTQSAFQYATDGDFHGFEKPYFLEEMLFYPKCDCEDRAIFYSYLLENVAGIENHLIQYPGHEATALTLPGENLEGSYYNHRGKKFYISDPTYIGASIGMCMPTYENTTPTIDYESK